jgi:AraC family transcriptional regulator
MPALNSVHRSASQWSPALVPGPSSDTFGRRPSLRLAASADELRGLAGVSGESAWMKRPEPSQNSDPLRILMRRWKDESTSVRQHHSAGDSDFAVVAIALRPTEGAISAGGRCLNNGRIQGGMTIMTPPGVASSAEFRAPCDFLHLFVPVSRLSEIGNSVENPRGCILGEPLAPTVADAVIERLAWLLLKSSDRQACTSELYVDGIAVAIVARLLDACGAASAPATSLNGLVKWRLKRVQDFIEAELSEPLSLADLARCAGLSRMHFAAQFRAATGMRPHEYVVRRRIQRAQEMLLTTAEPLVEVALSVGFQTQAHFTTVFRRLLGETPGRWRQLQRFG